MDRLSDIGERGLIDLIRRQAPTKESVVVGIGDDTAVLRSTSKKHDLLTTDMLSEGVHFTLKDSPRGIGHKALAVSISDIASMGGLPTYAVVSFGGPGQLNDKFVKGVLSGITCCAKKYQIAIVGGDTIRSKNVVINIALMGEVRKKELVLRKGAKAGDILFVTGALGRSHKSKKHLTFEPRLKESQYLVKKFKPSSMIDISDGLVEDLNHILKASCRGAVLFEKKIPRTKKASLEAALYDGEDFELLFTLSCSQAQALNKAKHHFKFFPIGKITGKKGSLVVLQKEGKELRLKKGFKHFT